MASDADYVCSLSPVALEKAKRELNEDPANRLGAVQTLREWVQQQPHLVFDTSTMNLLNFLRTAKFSQLRARELIEGNMTLRTDLPHWYHNLDPLDDDQVIVIRLGAITPLPGRDKEGRKVILFRQGSFTKEFMDSIAKDKAKRRKMFKGFMMVLWALLREEDTQVHGFLYLQDFTGYTMQHVSMMDRAEVKDMMRWQGNSPGRFKGFLYYNTPSIFEIVMDIVRPFMSKKFKDRIKLLGSNLENVYKHVPMEMLPVEYLPDDYKGPNAGTLEQLSENLLKQLQSPEVRKTIVDGTDPKWRIDKAKKDSLHPSASFRKLNID